MTRTTPIGRARSVVVVLAATQLASVGVGQAWAATTGRWVPTKNLMSARHFEASAALLADGRVLVAGDQGVRGSADLYDPRTRSFTATADMSFPRALFTLTRLADGTVLAPGGFNDLNQIVLSSVELYHPDTGTWTLTGHLGQKRDQYASAHLHDGTVLVAGGTPK